MNPIIMAAAVVCAVAAVFAPPILNVLFLCMAYVYWKASAL